MTNRALFEWSCNGRECPAVERSANLPEGWSSTFDEEEHTDAAMYRHFCSSCTAKRKALKQQAHNLSEEIERCGFA